MKYMTATRAVLAGILNLSEILPVYLVTKETVSDSCGNLPATNAAYLAGFNCYTWEISTLSHRILNNGPSNLDKFAMENWSVTITVILSIHVLCTEKPTFIIITQPKS